MYTQLFNLIADIQPVSAALQEALPSFLIREKLPKKTLLLRESKVCDRLYFIEKGMVRAFYRHDGQETTDWFMQEGDLIISVYSFYLQKPSFENYRTARRLYVGLNPLPGLAEDLPAVSGV